MSAAVIAVVMVSASASAADLAERWPVAPAAATGSRWAWGADIYTWATSIDGRFRTLPPGQAVKIHLGFGDVLKHLDGAVMVSADARRDRFVLFSDLMVSKLSAGKTFTARGYPGRVSLESSSVVGLMAAGWRVVDDPTDKLDLLGGVRGFALSNTIGVVVRPAALSYGKDRQWVDAVVGARASHAFTERWSVTGIGFVGAGGSNYEWDAFGGVGYRFGDTMTGFAGYRAMKVDYERGSFVYDALQYGPVIGMRVNF